MQTYNIIFFILFFSNSKNEDDGDKVEIKDQQWTKQDSQEKNAIESTKMVKTNSPKSVASMCRQFELNNKISAS